MQSSSPAGSADAVWVGPLCSPHTYFLGHFSLNHSWRLQAMV